MKTRLTMVANIALLIRTICLCAFFSLAVSVQHVVAKERACELTNDALESMPMVNVTITREDGTQINLNARLADKNVTRSAGFQFVCESTIALMPILFVFDRPLKPSFHMNNVVAPIDIAFVRASSTIDVIHTMKPYSIMMLIKPTYTSKRPVIAALEAHEYFFSDNNIDANSQISWQKLN